MAGIAGAGPVLVEPAVAAVSSTGGVLVPAIFILAVMWFESQKGESGWPTDVDVMEDEE